MSSICRFWESRARTSRPARLESSTASQALHVSYNWEPNLFFKRSAWYLFDCTTIYFLLCGGGGRPPPPLPPVGGGGGHLWSHLVCANWVKKKKPTGQEFSVMPWA